MQTAVKSKKFVLSKIKKDPEWAFSGDRSVSRWTHGHHRYPAKFLPNLVKKLIEKYAHEGDIIADLFAGCGTTLVEAKAHGFNSIGVDINPVAELITRAKINPIEPTLLNREIAFLLASISEYPKELKIQQRHERIDYWFTEENKNKISFLYGVILENQNQNVQDFFLCALSNILKNTSRWLQSSTKPQIDPRKIPTDPFIELPRQLSRMSKKNNEFYAELKKTGYLNTSCKIKLADARKTGIRKSSVGLIVTSPPYVTSYEYADIHQLTGYWYEYISDIKDFRRNFIGTFYSKNTEYKANSKGAQVIVDLLKVRDQRTAREVANYFNDMQDVLHESSRILKPGGAICMVVGDTTFKGVKIKTTECLIEMMEKSGLTVEEVIKREIPFKIIPTIRDKKTGKFTTLQNKDSKLSYPDEYILIAKKDGEEKNRQKSR